MAGDPSRSRGSADGSVIEAVQVTEAFRGKLIQVGGLGIFTTVTTQPRDAIVLAGDPEDVRAVFVLAV